MSGRHGRLIGGFLMLALVALMAACASPPDKVPGSYAVLLPNADGTLGRVVIRGPGGEQTLTQARSGASLRGDTPAFSVSQEQLTRDFGAAMAAAPLPPEQFLLYFESGGSNLTPESRALLPQIVERARARATLDLSVIGHSDTVGKADVNESLSLKRATMIVEQLRAIGLPDASIAIESHGERNLLVPTADEVAEPRNRRVEVTLR